MYTHFDGLAFLLPLLPGIPEVTDEFFLFGIYTDDRLSVFYRRLSTSVQVMKLRIPIRVLRAFPRLADALQTVSFRCQQIAHRALPHRMVRLRQFLRQFCRTLARPPQRGLRIA